MPRMFKFNNIIHPQQLPTPSSPIASNDETANISMPSTPTSHLSQSPGAESPSSSSASSMVRGVNNNSSRLNNRRRRTLRNETKRPYHSPNHVSPPHDKPMTKNDIYFALDCEMVGVGPEGLDSAVARVTLCNWAEVVILDTFVKVPVKVTDYRTFVSGIEAKDLEGDAMSLAEVQKLVKSILHGKILIGHALENDLQALQISHPWHDIRDSAIYPPFMREGESSADSKTVLRPRKLKELAQDKLGLDIQNLGEAHDPIEDARAALALYKLERMEWEKYIMKKVASAKSVGETRESQPSGRGSPPNQQLTSAPPLPNNYPHMLPPPKQEQNMNYRSSSRSLYHRSRSAPTAGMTPHHQAAYGRQHHQQQHQVTTASYYHPHGYQHQHQHQQHHRHYLY